MSLKKLLTAIVTVSMIFSLVVPAVSADSASDLISAAVGRLTKFGIVSGDQNGDLHLNDTITRAEIMKVLVTAAGKQSDANLLRGASAFTDTQSHWASGYVALAKAMGLTLGYPDGSFKPDNKITYGEIITLVARFVGLDVSKQAYTWPNNYIHAAMDAGIIPAGIDATKVAGEFAIRSWVFVLSDQGFLTVQLPSGKTVYQTYFVTTPPTLTVDQGASLTTSKDSVTISGTTNGSAVTVNGSPVALSSGAFSTTVSVALGSSSIKVIALDPVGNSTAASVAVTRTTAAAASITVDLAAGSNLTAGSTTAVHATVKDSFGNAIASPTVTATCDAAVGTIDASLNLTVAQKTGTGSCTFTSGAATTGAISANVVAGTLSTLTISGNATMSSSARQALTVSGADQYGNAVTPSGVVWSATAGVIDQSGNFAAGGSTGNVTITATAGGVSASKTVSVFGAAAGIKLALSSNNIVANGSSTSTVTATVVDAGGNTVANFAGNVAFSITNGTVGYFGSTAGTVSSGNIAASGGVASAAITAGATVGSAIITASIPGSGISSTTGQNVTLTTVAQTLTSVSITASPATLSADNSSVSTLTITALDQAGVQMTSLSSAVVVTLQSSNTGVGSLNNTSATLSGTNTSITTVSVNAGNVYGTTTVSATGITVGGAASSITATSATVTTAAIGSPVALTVDSPATTPASDSASGTTATGVAKLTIRLKDYQGNQVTNTSQNGQATLTLKADNTDVFWSTDASTWHQITSNGITGLSFSNGAAKVYVRNGVAEVTNWTATGTTGGTNSQALTSATAAQTFTAGAAAALTLTATPSTLSANGSMQGTLKVTIIDATAAKNVVTAGSYSVKITRSANPAGVVANWTDQTVTTTNGVATVPIQASTLASNTGDSFSASTTIGSSTVYSNGNAATIVKSAIIGVSSKLGVDTGSANTGNAGTAATIKVDVNDSSPQINVADNSTVVTLTLTGETSGTVSTYTATAANGVASFSVTLNSAEVYDLGAAASGLTSASATGAITISAGSAVGLKAKLPTGVPSTLAADGGQTSVTLTAVGVDKFGNETSVPNGVGIKWSTAGSTNSASLSSTIYNPTTLSTTGYPGALTVTVADSNATVTSGTLNLTTVSVGPVVGVTLSVGAAATVDGGNTSAQKVTVTAVDALGNRVTGATSVVYLGSDGSSLITNGDTVNSQLSGHTLGTSDLGAFTFQVKDTKAQTVNYKAYTGSSTQVAGTGSFTSGSADHLYVGLASPGAVLGDGSSIASVTGAVKDVYNNTVTAVNGSLKFYISGGTNFAYLQGADSSGYVAVPMAGGQASAIIQARNVTSPAFVTVTASCSGCTNSSGTSITPGQVSTDPAIAGTAGYSGALWVFQSGNTDAATVAGTSSIVYSATAGTATVTMGFNQPIKVSLANTPTNYAQLTAGFSGATTVAAAAQGSDAYHVVFTFSGVTKTAGTGTAVLSVTSANAAVYGYNNQAVVGTTGSLTIG